MQAEVAARIFHDWALQEGVLAIGGMAAASPPEDLALVSPVTEAGKAILRSKQVLSVGFNESAKEITAYTRLAAPTGKKSLGLLPSRIDDVVIRYRQGNHSRAGELPPSPQGGPPYAIRPVGGVGRYTCGSSISVGNAIDGGTLGALVRDAAGNIFGLSNNHVVAACNFAERGLPIVAPGLVDVYAGGLNPFTVGTHHFALALNIGSPSNVVVADNTDAAIFRLLNPTQLSSFQQGYFDTPQVTAPITAGMAVSKVGRTTGRTIGTVKSQMYGPFSVRYNATQYNFSGEIFFDNVFRVEGNGSAFSESGDSGSLVVSEIGGTLHAVGIVFAGGEDTKAPGGSVTFVLPIEPILQRLGVTLVGGHNV